mmetsp:Transcript_105357/g.296580  ORF Transcript_105357/g.296580 Transcript_105357/m.296580 type:complete len:352 (-) Transcript_105357:755-1810(-)
MLFGNFSGYDMLKLPQHRSEPLELRVASTSEGGVVQRRPSTFLQVLLQLGQLLQFGYAPLLLLVRNEGLVLRSGDATLGLAKRLTRHVRSVLGLGHTLAERVEHGAAATQLLADFIRTPHCARNPPRKLHQDLAEQLSAPFCCSVYHRRRCVLHGRCGPFLASGAISGAGELGTQRGNQSRAEALIVLGIGALFNVLNRINGADVFAAIFMDEARPKAIATDRPPSARLVGKEPVLPLQVVVELPPFAKLHLHRHCAQPPLRRADLLQHSGQTGIPILRQLLHACQQMPEMSDARQHRTVCRCGDVLQSLPRVSGIQLGKQPFQTIPGADAHLATLIEEANLWVGDVDAHH